MNHHASTYSTPDSATPLYLFKKNSFYFKALLKIITALLMIHLSRLAFPDPVWSRLSISQMAGQYGASIVRIHTYNEKGESVGTGTGFFIDEQGALVTNHHVLEKCTRALIQTWNGEKGEITGIIEDDPEGDLLMAGTTFKNTRPIPIQRRAEAGISEEVVCFGNAREFPHTISMGRVTGIIPVHDFRVLEISAPVPPGVSGAPVLNRDGELIAIAAAYLDPEKGLFFAVPAANLVRLKKVDLALESLPVSRIRLGATMEGGKLIGLGLYEFRQSPLTVYFKNGRHKQCDRAWLQGNTVYLVMKGKAFAVGYPRDEIDMWKSFKRSFTRRPGGHSVFF